MAMGKIEACLSDEAHCAPAPDDAAEVGVRRVPVPAGGDHGDGPLVPAGMACPTVISRNCWSNAVSRSTTSAYSGG